MADEPFELEQRIEGPHGPALQVKPLCGKDLRNDLLRRRGQPDIGDIVHPVQKLRVQVVETAERSYQEEVLSHITERLFHLSVLLARYNRQARGSGHPHL